MKCFVPIVFTILMIHPSSVSDAQSAFSFGSPGQEYGKAAAVDQEGNAVIAALFQGTIAPHPASPVRLTSVGGVDMVLAKYAPDGDLIWAISVGGPQSTDVPHAVAYDKQGNIVVAGYFGLPGPGGRTCDFDPGPGERTLVSAGGYDAFVAKYSAGGALLWTRRIANATDTTEDRAWDLTIDSEGRIHVTGAFSGRIDIGDGVSAEASGSDIELFIASYSANGDPIRVVTVPVNMLNVFTEAYAAVDADSEGNLWLAGNFRGDVDFDPGTGTALLQSRGMTDMFLARYDAGDGSFEWVGQMGGSGQDIISPGAMRVDDRGRPALTGRLRGTADLSPTGGSMVTGTLFLAAYDTEGALRFGFVVPGASQNSGGHRVAFDEAGNVYVAGWVGGAPDFDTGSGSMIRPASGTQDVFLAKYSEGGNVLWANVLGAPGNTGNDICAGLAVDAGGNAWITGQFYGIGADYDPSEKAFLLSSVGMNDCFVAKYSPDGSLWSSATSVALPTDAQSLRILSVAPSPVRSQGMVTFTSDRARDLDIVVFDLLGREVLRRELGLLDAGGHRLALPFNSLPSGTYIISLQSDLATQQMLITVL
ncbi:MAG: hypothetical protein IH600_12465 [Bacteroidetes bacterium]|nr:hypothetical protein [Bacteroidota bacterium]